MSGYFQYEAVCVRSILVDKTVTNPEYFDNQGTGSITMVISIVSIVWRPIVADQSPGILDAVSKLKLPKPEIIVSLLLWRAQTIAAANSGHIFSGVKILLERYGVHANLLGQVSSGQ
jgi:hypothetical protein